MTNPIVVQILLQNLATKPRTFSLEPYGGSCELDPRSKAYASWELTPDGNLELEIAVTEDAVLVWDSSKPQGELRPIRDETGDDLWA